MNYLAARRFGLAPAAAVLWLALGWTASSAYEPVGPGAITASIRDRDGRPIAAAAVTVRGPAMRQATTTRAGIVSLAALPLGTYELRVVSPGFEPKQTRVVLQPARGIVAVDVRLDRSTAGVRPGALDALPRDIVTTGQDASLPHALAAAPELLLDAHPSAPNLTSFHFNGAAPYESRVTLDGIPLGGPAGGALAARFDPLVLEQFAALAAPDVSSAALDGTIAGLVDFRTRPLGSQSALSVEAGHDTSFGPYQTLHATRAYGKLSVALDAVTGDGVDRTQIAKTRYAFSNVTSLTLASYGEQSSATDGNTTIATLAPAYAADLATNAFGGALVGRIYGSEFNGFAASPSSTTTFAADRIRGTTFDFERPFGQHSFGLTYDRRDEHVLGTRVENSAGLATLTLHGDLRVGPGGRLEIADARSSGTLFAPRQDVRAAFVLPAGAGWTLRASAGSAFATAPYELLATQATATALSPETAVGYRVGADLALSAQNAFSLGAFRQTRWNRFAPLADARTGGFDIGFSRTPGGPGLAYDARLALVSETAFGPRQPAARVIDEFALLGGANSDAASRAHFALGYRSGAGTEFGLETDYFGRDERAAGRATTLTLFRAQIPLAGDFGARFDVGSPLGSTVRRTFGFALVDGARSQ